VNPKYEPQDEVDREHDKTPTKDRSLDLLLLE